jgi:predicted NBD/HSP70 family sugar kinase
MKHPRGGTRRHTPSEPGNTPPRAPGRSPTQIAEHNLRVTLEAIRRDGPLTRLELGRRSGLTAPGITNIVRRLSEDGLVMARKRVDPVSGQPSTEFSLNADGAFSVGIRLHDRFAEAVLVDLAGTVRERTSLGINRDLAESLSNVLDRFTQHHGGKRQLLGIGIAADDKDRIDLDPLRAALAPWKIVTERDCVAAVLAERTCGVGVVEGGLMFIVLDDTVRAGFLLQGVPFGGVHGRAGSIGSMRTGADHVPLNSVVGLETFREILTEAERFDLADGKQLPLTPEVTAWIRRAAGHLLDAIVATAGFLAPGAILIGGDLPRNLIDALIAQMSIERGDTAIRPIATPWISPIRPGSFPGAGIALGAALLPFFETLLPSPLAG